MEFLVFGEDWGRFPHSTEHIFRCLLDEHRVVWVNTIGTRSPRLTPYDVKRSLEKVRSWTRPRPREDAGGGNPAVVSPVIVPFNQMGAVRGLNRRLMRRRLDPVVAEAGFTDYTIVTSVPTVADYLEDHPGALRVYYCVDDFTVMPGVDAAVVGALEKRLIDACDLAFYTAKPLLPKFKEFRGPCRYLPHGVDADHFRTDRRAALPREPAGPVVGFFGLFSEWVDYDLYAGLIRRRPDWTFLLIGGADVDITGLASLPNVIWTGGVPYAELPAYAAWFDVGIIPFVQNRLTEAFNPLKFLEYLALGLPVVSTPMPELDPFADHNRTAATPEEFESAIAAALSEDNDSLRRARRRIAQDNSWRSRAATMLSAIRELKTGRA